MQAAYEKASRKLRLPAAVALPGLPSSYCKVAYDDRSASAFFSGWNSFDTGHTYGSLLSNPTDRSIEQAVINIVTTHRACANTGLGMTLDPVPSDLFGRVTQLEEHCRKGAKKPQFIWKTLGEIGRVMGDRLTPLQCAQLARASQITAFTNFPLGYTILPGDTAPLMCRVPIAYRPLLPLTRTLQQELATPGIVYIGDSVKVLLAEALLPSDRIRRESLQGLQFIKENVGNNPKVCVELREVATPDELRQAIAVEKPDILLLSSHGGYFPERKLAGLYVGGELRIGPELGPMPPVVILSACHVAPRGTGAVNIAELLFREGALAVLATQIPVHVRRNIHLTMRFLLYIAESLARREPHATLAEVWHRAATSNAILDILSGDDALDRWAHERRNGISPLEDFMTSRSAGRLRLGHIYEDSEAILLELATEHGMDGQVRAHIEKKAYVPETLFYFLMGWPERIRLNDPMIQKYR